MGRGCCGHAHKQIVWRTAGGRREQGDALKVDVNPAACIREEARLPTLRV